MFQCFQWHKYDSDDENPSPLMTTPPPPPNEPTLGEKMVQDSTECASKEFDVVLWTVTTRSYMALGIASKRAESIVSEIHLAAIDC
jgi:hypothetical protein